MRVFNVTELYCCSGCGTEAGRVLLTTDLPRDPLEVRQDRARVLKELRQKAWKVRKENGLFALTCPSCLSNREKHGG